MTKRKTKQCDKCERYISLQNFSKHYKSCKGNIDRNSLKLNEEWKQSNSKYKCLECGKEYSRKGIISHLWKSHSEDGKKHKPTLGLKKGIWNKGLKKETDERVKQIGETYSKRIKRGEILPSFLNKHHTVKTKNNISLKLSINNKGGKSKWYEVTNGHGEIIKVQGTWEREFSKVLNIIDKDWIKPGVGNKKHTFKWLDKDNKIHQYTPDFWCPNLKKYFEIKGYWWGNDKIKMKLVLEQNNINIEIVEKNKYKEYLKIIK